MTFNIITNLFNFLYIFISSGKINVNSALQQVSPSIDPDPLNLPMPLFQFITSVKISNFVFGVTFF